MYAKKFQLYPKHHLDQFHIPLTAKENKVPPPPCYVGATGLKKGYLGSESTSFVVENLTIFLALIYTDMLIEIGQTMNNFND